MRRETLTFYRNDEPLAKLVLDLSPSGMSVTKWTWEGDGAMRRLLAPAFPNQEMTLYGNWYSDALDVTRREGLTFSTHYEGEPIQALDRFYADDDLSGPAFQGRTPKW